MNQIGGGRAETRGEQAVGGGGRAAALQVAEDGRARFQAGEQFELMRQTQGAFGINQLGFGNDFLCLLVLLPGGVGLLLREFLLG